ncbi:leucine rich repeat protein [Ichthyophthirius multifiliis]|uniref:Leucine rich repeat protein n=1 Tax=Ichthyophthirius multifiliis TaxID=5932 RepID=G0R148_ICHMU|nr:leucine rich repeat protein [Ichthyophthirius multifiliis]EGR28815.1 leucine rich repeat protein [Ichthyophthirius multifiliis]|eukprot:XP_004030051.1 leucine rich repeat protein [Ichthyophthirius multifiliis]
MQKSLHNINLQKSGYINNPKNNISSLKNGDKYKIIKETISKDAKPLDFSFKQISDLQELKTTEPRNGKRKPIVIQTVEIIQGDKKLGDEDSKKDQEENEEKENEENEEEKVNRESKSKEIKEDKKKSDRKEPEIIRAVTQNIAANIVQNYHLPLNPGVVKGQIDHKAIEDVRNTQKKPIISLTIHGNPVETITGFRQFIITVIPSLKNLDTAHVSKKERDYSDFSIFKMMSNIPPPVKNPALPPEENVGNDVKTNSA